MMLSSFRRPLCSTSRCSRRAMVEVIPQMMDPTSSRGAINSKHLIPSYCLINQINIRSISTCLHIKGLPTSLSKPQVYNFFKPYGPITEVATYNEAPKYDEQKGRNRDDAMLRKRRHFICHERPPGQTAVINFETANSAIMCKEELHWRPFPVSGEYALSEEIIGTNPRDRPILNILFETSHMRDRLRPWVHRDLMLSKKDIKLWDRKENLL
mmetsp:Transcript_16318/g.19936  ORF Transcript_16318/g.19936 Transcript_16318/m.19936 type:complete len:212 (-) Transcript_16318:281-916(-)